MFAVGSQPQAIIPSAIRVLGFVSLFMHISSEMIHSLLPVYMKPCLAPTEV
jgi:hypothetical protein